MQVDTLMQKLLQMLALTPVECASSRQDKYQLRDEARLQVPIHR